MKNPQTYKEIADEKRYRSDFRKYKKKVFLEKVIGAKLITKRTEHSMKL